VIAAKADSTLISLGPETFLASSAALTILGTNAAHTLTAPNPFKNDLRSIFSPLSFNLFL
jgi:hypothetical protein